MLQHNSIKIELLVLLIYKNKILYVTINNNDNNVLVGSLYVPLKM